MARFVLSRASGPGLIGRTAAGLCRPGNRLIYARGPDIRFDIHACQHATADGRLVENFVLWAERAGVAWTIMPAEADTLLALDGRAVVVLDPLLLGAGPEIADLARAVGARPQHVWTDLGTDPDPADAGDGGPVVGVLGDEERLRRVYPAVLAALGDAMAAQGLAWTVRVIAADRALADPAEALAGVAGVILPGGADMGQVAPQTAVAGAARAADLPLLGLCLGMQSLVLAALRGPGGLPAATLEEIDPSAGTLAFRRLRGPDGRPLHRVGDVAAMVRPGSRLAAALASAGRSDRLLLERANHRYALDPAFLPHLVAAGLRVVAGDLTQPDRPIVHVVEDPAARCHMGFQGHPELQSRPGAPHPGFALFARAIVRAVNGA